MNDYTIFVITSTECGTVSRLDYQDKDLANTIWLDFHQSKTPTITLHDGKYQIHDCVMKHQPKRHDPWPEWALDRWRAGKNIDGYLGASCLKFEDLGLCKFEEEIFDEATGLTTHNIVFFTYKNLPLFSVTKYD